ncbi:MBOAT family O-acyltransferase [Oryzibacter oryziterrae]|uniref:MBOAT family O-acyltransferase n=1 Tax=Oryzibacter oryziterrae TaxID=2766474 RepID=UPI001F287653|nr:MBOAT family protein [Oryzibacter oryziterrae]
MFFLLGNFNRRGAAIFLTFASFCFYAYWKIEFLPLLASSIIGNYLASLLISRWRGQTHGIVALGGAITLNLIALGFFKYYNFFVTSIDGLSKLFPTMNIELPIGISFFTFTQIAFLIDTWRKISEERNVIHYALFVTYFPHLIAGPVLHHKQMMPQFANESTYRFNIESFSIGIFYFVVGLFKKIVIADSFAPFASALFDHVSGGANPPILAAWIGALSYTFQIYFDFSGYSDMAVGISKMFGITLPFNFNSPYKSTNIITFWRRWHMSLSQFLRDYLYFPLGGNRNGKSRRYMNLMVTMLLGGLWHGANWTFVIWGGLHGLYLVINHAWRHLFSQDAPATAAGKAFGWVCTFLAVVVGWVFFRAQDWTQAVAILSAMTGISGVVLPTSMGATLGAAGQWLSTHGVAFTDAAFQVAGQEIRSPSRFARLAFAALVLIAMPNSQQIATFLGQAVKADTAGLSPRFARIFERRKMMATGIALSGIVLGIAFFVCLTLLRRKAEFLYFQF